MIQFTTAQTVFLIFAIGMFVLAIRFALALRYLGEKSTALVMDKKVEFRLHEGNPDMVRDRNTILSHIESMSTDADYTKVVLAVNIFEKTYASEPQLLHTLEDLAERVTKARRISTV